MHPESPDTHSNLFAEGEKRLEGGHVVVAVRNLDHLIRSRRSGTRCSGTIPPDLQVVQESPDLRVVQDQHCQTSGKAPSEEKHRQFRNSTVVCDRGA